MKISKTLALAICILLLVIGLFIGGQYQQKSSRQSNDRNNALFNTQTSEKPRDKIILYTVHKGETLPEIAQKFTLSENTILWENNMRKGTVTEGQVLRILPVTGVSHTVVEGDTLQSLADTYDTDPQMIIDFPYNTFMNPETFTLIPGTILIIPNGKK